MSASKAGSRPALTPPLKTFGGKHNLAARIVALFPRHLHYVEPFFGGGGPSCSPGTRTTSGSGCRPPRASPRSPTTSTAN
jgi:hypothetical protein